MLDEDLRLLERAANDGDVEAERLLAAEKARELGFQWPTDGVLALVVGAKPLKSPGALMIELSALREEDHGFSQFAQPFRYYCVGDAATRFARIVAHEGEAEDLIGRLVMVEIMLERDWSNGPSRWRMLVKNPKRPNPGVAQRAFAWLGAQDATGTQ